MPTNARTIDGVLVSWGDRLFYAPVRHRKTPDPIAHAIRSRRDRANHVRAQIRRTVRRVPEVMVKITGGGRGAGHIQAHLSYVSRNGKVALEDQQGDTIEGAHGVRALVDEWRAAGPGMQDESRLREAFNIMLSMPPGTDRAAVRAAARQFAQGEFGGRFDYVFASHEDEAHPHVHLTVRARGYDAKRLNPRKVDLQRWREAFAHELRERGIDANATSRRARGVTRRAVPQSVVHIARRREIPRFWREAMGGTEPDPLVHKDVVRSWGEMRQALSGSEILSDRELAGSIASFVLQMPAGKAVEHDARQAVRAVQRPAQQAPNPERG